MKKNLLFLIGGTFLFVGYKNLPDPMSNGAPAASTGAPDEKHCSNTGCHSTFAPNTGTAELSILVGNGITSYEPGKTYPVIVSITDPGRVRFGFQAAALNAENKNAGSINITEELRTQIIPGYGNMLDRKYVTYTYEGTNAVQTGLGKWEFEWTAPPASEGAITLYVGSVAANNDGTDAGDYTYSKKITLDAPSVSWSVYPNVSSGEFAVMGLESGVKMTIYNVSGKKVYESLSSGRENVVLLPSGMGQGVYFISVVQDGKTSVQKIVIAR